MLSGIDILAVPHLPKFLAKAWVFCYPSTYEGFGIPHIEAMASGTPIVTSYNPGALELLCNGHYGIICQDHEFGEKLVTVLAEDSIRQRFAERGLDRVKAFSADAVAARYLQIYKELARNLS
jgi:phosphatidyl-myo-inositol alpha-mannosyltransferase